MYNALSTFAVSGLSGMLVLNLLEGKTFNLVTATLALLGLLVTIAGVAIAIKTLRAKRRRLSISALPPAPLLTPHSRQVSKLEVAHNGVPLPDPHIVTFLLENFGDVSIDSSCFDRGRPITLNLGTEVVEILSVKRRPDANSSFANTAKSNAVTLGPDILKPGQRLSIQLLVAEEPDLEAPVEEYLANTDVEYVRPGYTPKFKPKSRLIDVLGFAPLLLVAAFLLGVIFTSSPSRKSSISYTPTKVAPGQSVEVSGMGFRPSDLVMVSIRCDLPGGSRFEGTRSNYYPMIEPTTDASGTFRVRAVIPAVPGLDDCKLEGRQQATGTWDTPWHAEADLSTP
jgi:hypothetical protein